MNESKSSDKREFQFPSLEWAKELCKAVNNDQHLEEIGKGFNEKITIIIKQEMGERKAITFTIKEGKCTGADYNSIQNEAQLDSDIILEANLDTWLKILTLKTTPTKALFTRKLRIVKGDKLMIFSRPIAHYYILYHASRITNPQRDT